MLFKKLGTFTFVLFLLTTFLYAQEDVLTLDPLVDLQDQIAADTVANNGIPDNRVYELVRDDFYLNDAAFAVPAGKTLRIRGAAGTGKKPVIYMAEAPGTGRPPGNFIVLNGGNLELSDVCIVGFFEDDWDEAWGLAGVQGNLIRTTAAGSSLILNNVVMSNINGQHIRIEAASQRLEVRNSVFANMGTLTTSNFGAGKGVDLRDVAHDTVIFVNNTFVNSQDRIIRHLDLSSGGTNTGAIKYLLFDHNTIINSMSFHGTLSLGNVSDQIVITNNLFVDAFALGEDTSDATRASEWLRTGETYENGRSRMTWVLSVPNDATQWTVSGNYYAVSPEGQAWLDKDHFGFGAFNVGTPLSYHVNGKLGADSLTAFQQIDLSLVETPALMTNLMDYYEDPAFGNRTKTVTNYDPDVHDFDRRKVEYFTDTLDASYPSSSEAYSGAENGYPAGDLNWFPDRKTDWENGVLPFELTVDGDKDEFYNSLTGPDDGYLQIRNFAHSDNGQPVDDADCSAKVWSAWSPDWLYMYLEVMDDTISHGTTTNVWETDNLELKFDPQATDSVANSIWDVRLTGPFSGAPADSLNGVTNAADKKWAKKTIEGGYSLELAVRWSVIGSAEKISVAVDSVFGLAINVHDNDGRARQSSVIWAARMLDAVWNTPKYLGTITFLADNKLQFAARNNMTGYTNPMAYDGSVVDGVDGSEIIPLEFALKQNYPNPFNPSTKIFFTLKESGFTTLSIYNILGQKVATLVSKELSSGQHSVDFNAANLSSGIYLYKLESAGNVSTKKMTLMK